MFVFFNWLTRSVLFWLIAAAAVLLAAKELPFINLPLVWGTILGATSGNIESISKPAFAYGLAGGLFFTGIGFAAAFYICHVFPVQIALWRATGQVTRAKGKERGRDAIRKFFASNFESLRQTLERNSLIGHAWLEFEETLFNTDGDRAIGNTVRPQTFFNLALARERLSGLKMMNAVPGYFVGVGLLLTFIGLVFALYKAGAAANAGDADKMAQEMGALLQIATFKFSTSIAGLGASIVLSVIFRWYFVLVESAFERFNATLERGLLYTAPQSISLEMNRTLQDQLVQLKDITQGEFFSRMGSELAPRLNAAIVEAMAPVTDQIGNAVGSLTANSQDGVQQMLHKFTDSLQHGAGTELRELAATLKQLQMSIVEMQGGLRGSGDEFATKLSDAADNLNRMVERAGQSFETSSGQSRDALATVMDLLRQTVEKANAEIDTALGTAASGASTKLEAAMGLVMDKLDKRIGELGDGLQTMQRTMGEHGDAARRQIEVSVSQSTDMQKAVLSELEATVQGISGRISSAVEDAVASVGRRFDELAASMRAIEGALIGQKAALEGASSEARKTAEALGKSAQSVQAATAPLVSVGDRFSLATEKMTEGVTATLDALKLAQSEMAGLAADLSAANKSSGDFWNNFAGKFDDVDTALGEAVSVLSRSTSDQQQRLETHVQSVDRGLSEAIGKLSGILTQMSDSAESIADSLEAAKVGGALSSSNGARGTQQ
ncbi:conserved membrane hypothetical protein [Mesorhizobium sp. SOD10]|nr:conserved membrane hypothetical protein [Mesorhizobium sp. SOD10]